MDYQHDFFLYAIVFASAFFITLLTTPLVKKLALRFGVSQTPRTRDMHDRPMPLMGGLAIILGFFLTSAGLAFIMREFRDFEFLGIAIGALIIAAIGVIDDARGLRPRYKLIFQVLAALIVAWSGVRIELIYWPFPAYFEMFSVPLTILWVVGMTNAVNLIDGLDGLAAGVSAIGSICLMILCALSGSPMAVLLSAMLAGACLGFLPRNFNPAEIFMGDTGAMFIGYIIAVSSIIGVFKGYALLAAFIVFFALVIPISDTGFAIFRRIKNREGLMSADRGHLHHKLVNAGYTHKQSVALLYIASGLSAALAIVIALRDVRALLVALIFLSTLFAAFIVYSKRAKNNDSKKKEN